MMDKKEHENNGDDGNGKGTPSGTPSPSPLDKDKDKGRPIFLSNNFENYLKMRGINKEDENHDNEQQNHDDTQENERQWNHFTSPFNNPTQPKLDNKNKATTSKHSSVFSDMERSQTVDRFANILMERMGNVMSSGKLAQAWQSSGDGNGGNSGSIFSLLLTDYSPDASQNQESQSINSNDYNAERKMIKPHLTPMIWGSSVMFVTLFSMRLGRWYQGRHVVGRTLSNRASSSNQRTTNNAKSLQDARHTKQGQNYNNNSDSPFNPRNELKKELMSSLNTLPVDMALSMLTGISTTVFLTRPHYLMKDFSNAPLLEGKSVLAEELCLPFRKEMDNVNGMFHTYTPYTNANKDMPVQRQVVPYSELWKDENLGEFDSLRSIRDFVVNCHERE